MKKYWMLALLLGVVVTSGDACASVKDRISHWNQGDYATKPMEKPHSEVGRLSKDRLKAVETPKEAAPKAHMEVGHELGKMTKECETKHEKEHHDKVMARCKKARETGGKDWKDFYADYESRWNKGLHALTEKRSIKTAADARHKGTALTKLGSHANCHAFATHMSMVHPANNDAFEATMQCVASQRKDSGYEK